MSTPDPEMTPAPRSYEAVLSRIEAELRDDKIKVGDQLPGNGRWLGSIKFPGRRSGMPFGAWPPPSVYTWQPIIFQLRILSRPASCSRPGPRRKPRKSPVRQGQQLRALLLAMEKPGLDREEFHVLDAAFHVQLSSLAGDAVITSMMESLRSAIQGHVGAAIRSAVIRSAAIRSDAPWQRIVPTLREQHGHILTAVLAHDGGAAAATPTEHIQWFHTNYNKS